MRLDARRTTPWAHEQLAKTPALAIAIDMAEPKDALVGFGYSSGWTCRILEPDTLRLIGEAYGKGSPAHAFAAALEMAEVAA
jgi:hypothetical protein